MHYNWKVYGKYECPKCGWQLARKKAEHEKAVSICCRCKSEMVDITPQKILAVAVGGNGRK